MKKTQSQQPRPLPNHHTSTPSAESVASFKNARLTASLIAASNSPHPSGFQSGATACSNFKENILSTSSPHRQIVIPAAGRLHRKPPLSTALTASNGPAVPNNTASALSLTGGHKHPPTTTSATKSARASFFKSVISYCSPASNSQPQTTRKSPTPQPQAGRQGLLSATKSRQSKSKTASSGRLLTLDDSDAKNERRQTTSAASLQCAICFEQYCSSVDGNRETRRPRILPLCGHSICSECLLRAISLSLRDGIGLNCHICKKEIPHDILKQSTMTRSKKQRDVQAPPSLQGFPVNWSLAELAEQQQNEKRSVRQWQHTPSALAVEVPGLTQVKGDAMLDHTFSPLNRHPGDPGEHTGEGDIDQERSTKGSSNYKFQERKSADDGMRGTVDSFLARRSEGTPLQHPLLSLRSMCFQCRGQNADTHFCRAHLLKFCSQCALKHLKGHGECDASNIIEVGQFDDYSQEVKNRASQFRARLEEWEISLQNEKTEIASEIYDKLDSLIEMLAQMKRDVRQHYDLRSYILIQYGERVEKALKNLQEINTHQVDTFNFQKMRDAALRMNRLGEVMAEAETLLETHVNITNALHFSSKNYQQLQLALVELISKEDLSSFVGLGGSDPKTPLNPISRNRPMVFSRTAPSRKDEMEQEQKQELLPYVRSGGESESDFQHGYPKTQQPTAHTSLHTSPYPRHLQLSEKRRVLNEIEQNQNREEGGADQGFGKIEFGDKKGPLFEESLVPRKELFEACALGYLRSVQFLLDNFDFPGGINVRDVTGCTPFLRAAQAQQSEVYRALARKYFSNVNVQDHNGRTALIHAAMTNDLQLARFLVEECKANTNLQTKWKDTALHFAVSHDNEVLVRLLVEGGANCKIPNSEGRPPLAKSESVRLLL